VQVLEPYQLESFNKSLNARPLYIPASNYLSEQDTIYEARDKGGALLCMLENPGGTPQSRYTTIHSVESYGWSWTEDLHHDHESTVLTNLELVFHDLGIVYNQLQNNIVTWHHNRRSYNLQGELVEVWTCRLY
jgi:hypothetical protein